MGKLFITVLRYIKLLETLRRAGTQVYSKYSEYKTNYKPQQDLKPQNIIGFLDSMPLPGSGNVVYKYLIYSNWKVLKFYMYLIIRFL